jgi:hypothetical protein
MPIRGRWIPFRMPEIRALPLNQTGVYEIGKAVGDKVLYIGKSNRCIRSRLLMHKEKTKFRVCTHFRKQQTPPDDARITEGKLLEATRENMANTHLSTKIGLQKMS